VFHNVYIDPSAYAHFLARKEFPDPTILVMELFAAEGRDPNGVVAAGVFNGRRLGAEVAVKNSRRPDNSSTLWAYYDFGAGADGSSAEASPDRECESCHRQHAGVQGIKDNVWVQPCA
jgi:cytochrome P460